MYEWKKLNRKNKKKKYFKIGEETPFKINVRRLKRRKKW